MNPLDLMCVLGACCSGFHLLDPRSAAEQGPRLPVLWLLQERIHGQGPSTEHAVMMTSDAIIRVF